VGDDESEMFRDPELPSAWLFMRPKVPGRPITFMSHEDEDWKGAEVGDESGDEVPGVETERR